MKTHLFKQGLTVLTASAALIGAVATVHGGASNDMQPNLQHPENPVPLMDIHKLVQVIGSGD